MDTGVTRWVEPVAHWIEMAGVAVIVLGGLAATVLFLVALGRRSDFSSAYTSYRRDLGRAILLGLEFLVAGDIIATILIQPTLEGAAALGLIVLIRTFLSFSLETEIEGRLPWHAARADGTEAV
jgi:uncharacterized membrane protein